MRYNGIPSIKHGVSCAVIHAYSGKHDGPLSGHFGKLYFMIVWMRVSHCMFMCIIYGRGGWGWGKGGLGP